MAGNGALVVAILALASAYALAYDPSPLQDFCVADMTKDLFVNGFPCKDPRKVTPDDFVFSGIGMPADTDNMVGSNVTNVNVLNFPGMNTLGISLARIDYAPNGLNPPHTHPRATEVLTLLEGELFAGFVTAPPPAGRLFAKMLKKGDVIIFPFGQIHFQMNVGKTPAVALSSLSSQFPGVIQIAPTLFGSDPAVPKEVLARAFQIDANLVGHLQKIFSSGSGRNY